MRNGRFVISQDASPLDAALIGIGASDTHRPREEFINPSDFP
jgi:hypothetical protein